METSNYEELVAFIDLLTIIYHASNKYEEAWEIAGIPTVGPRSTPVFWSSFYWRQEVTDVPLYPLQKNYMGSIL